MHRLTIATALVFALCTAPHAIAQTTTTPPAESTAPAPGANSFTEGQAKERIEKAGFSNVEGLRKDDQGIWRGSAKQGDKPVSVSVDFRGTVTAQ